MTNLNDDKKKAAAQERARNNARVKKSRELAARFYFKNVPGNVEDWVDDTTNDINLAEDVDKDVRDLAELMVTFHQECSREGL